MDLARVQQFQKESAANTEHLSALLSEGAAMIQSGRAAEAIELYHKFSQSLHEFDEKWKAELSGGDPAFAELCAKDVADRQTALLMAEGSACLMMGKFDQAGKCTEQALRLNPDPGPEHAFLIHGLARIRQQQASYAEAEELFRRAHAEFSAAASSMAATDSNMAAYFWQQAAQTLSDAAYSALTRGDQTGFEKTLDEAIGFATAHSLLELADKFWLRQSSYLLGVDATGEAILRINSQRRDRCARSKDPEFQFEALQLVAEYYRENGELELAREELEKARAFAPPLREWSLLRQIADIAESQGESAAAQKYGEDALSAARKIAYPDAVIATLRALVSFHAAGNPAEADRYLDELRTLGDKEEIKNALLSRALIYCKDKRFDLAFRDLDEAEKAMPEEAGVLFARVAALRGMGAKEEALRAAERAVTAFRKQFKVSGADWKSGLDSLGALHETAAFLSAELGRPEEAFRWAEGGKSLRLRSRLTDLSDAAKPPDIVFADLRERLRAESAVLLFFCVTQRGTLALLCDPNVPEPQPFFLDLTEKTVETLFPANRNSPHWNDAVFESVRPISEKLAACFKKIVDGGNTRLVYIVPDSQLYFFPFAALDLGDGSNLVEHCAIAQLPCAAMLVSRQQHNVDSKTCLALAGPEKKFSLADYATQIAGLPWASSQCLTEASTRDFVERSSQFDVLHFACHGQMEASSPGTLSASVLLLHDHSLSAKDVYGLSLESKLVFLNACVSGRFQSRLSNEVGGFWEAFLHAGANRVIATIAYVDPDSAQRLALSFYRNVLEGTGPAEALRQAQLELRQERPEPSDWATHILIGVA